MSSGSWEDDASGLEVEWERGAGEHVAPSDHTLGDGGKEETASWLLMPGLLLALAVLVGAMVMRRGQRPTPEATLTWRRKGGQGPTEMMMDDVSEVSSFIEARDEVQGSRAGGALSPLTSSRSHAPVSRISDTGTV
jgi:hypothetical protein